MRSGARRPRQRAPRSAGGRRPTLGSSSLFFSVVDSYVHVVGWIMLHGMRFLTRWLGRRDRLPESEIAYLICVEANRLEPQARLLCESIRTFGGRYRDAPILAVSPRPHLALGPEARAHLEALDVTYVVEPLNETGRPYGTINRIVTGAWAETFSSSPYLVLLDTDTVFVGEPTFVRADVGVRPVDVKGAASSGRGDPLEAYWTRMCGFGGIDPSRLPMLSTTIDKVRIRASYNGGFTVVRRDLGILRRTRDIFFASLQEDLRPLAGRELNVFASTGPVGLEASEWWGSSQAALSVAIWSRTSDVHTFDPRYNIPLNNLTGPGRSWPMRPGFQPILLHYHHLAEPEYQAHLRQALTRIGCSSDVFGWIEERLHFFSEGLRMPTRDSDESETGIVRRLVQHLHIDVPARRSLPDGRAALTLVVQAIVEIVSKAGSYPEGLRASDAYSGGILVQGEGGYEIHWRAEVGLARYATTGVSRYSSLQDAARAYALREWPDGIDGVPFDRAL